MSSNFLHQLLAIVLLATTGLAHAATTSEAGATPSQPLTITGTLEVLIADDFRNRRSHTSYEVRVRPGHRVPLDLQGEDARPLRTGMKVRVHGRFDGKRLSLRPSAATLEILSTPVAPADAPLIARSVLMILVDIQDGNGQTHAVSQMCDGTEDVASKLMWGTPSGTPHADLSFQESSYGEMGLGGFDYPGMPTDVLRVTITDLAYSPLTCEPSKWADMADAVVVANGVVLEMFNHVVYVLPPDDGCTWGGLGMLACGHGWIEDGLCRSWQATYTAHPYPCGTPGAYAHEIGHNVGMHHASTDLDNDGTTDLEYGDYSDFMGGGHHRAPPVNAPHRVQLGWVPETEIHDASAGGVFTLSALELADPAHPRVIRFVQPGLAPYYLSYRAPIGLAADMPDGEVYLERTNIHTWAGDYEQTRFIGALADGETRTLAGRFFVEQLSHDAQSATIRVGEMNLPTLGISGVTVDEGNAGTTIANFIVTLSAPVDWPVTYRLGTKDEDGGTATPYVDFAPSGLVFGAIPAGQTSVAFAVTIHGDTTQESNETFTVELLDPVGATIGTATATGTIRDDDDAVLSIADVVIAEGNAGTKYAVFTVQLSRPAPVPVTFDIATADGAAKAGVDYVARSLTAQSIPEGSLSKTFAVALIGDTTVEPNEGFQVKLTNIAGPTIGDALAMGVLLNDDGPTLSIADVSVVEGHAGTKLATFTVKLSQAAAVPVTYTIATGNGSALGTSDFVARTLVGETIPVGQTSRTFTVTVNGDTAAEGNEIFFVALSAASGATLFDGAAIGTIVNDDGRTLSIGDVVLAEGNDGATHPAFKVTLSQAATAPVTFAFATANGTASAGSDYTAQAPTTLTIPAGQTQAMLTIDVAGDGALEANETYFVNLANATNATILDGQGLGVIVNDDGPTLAVNDVTVVEGHSGTRWAVFTVSLSQAASVPVVFDFATSNASAVAGSDYVARSLVGHSIPAGMVAKTFGVQVNGDVAVEANELFRVQLTNATGATIADGVGVGTITNDD